MSQQPIENREIRGLTVRTAWWVISSIIALGFFCFSQFNRVVNAIKENDTQTKINTIAIQQLQTASQDIKARQDKLDMDMREIKVERALSKHYPLVNE